MEETATSSKSTKTADEKSKKIHVTKSSETKNHKVPDNHLVFSPKKTRSRTNQLKVEDSSKGRKLPSSIPQLDGGADIKGRSRAAAKRSKPIRDEDSDSDFEPVRGKKIAKASPVAEKPKSKPTSSLLERIKRVDRRVLSTDDEANEPTELNLEKSRATDFWPEVWLEKEQKWVAVDLLKSKVDAVPNIVVMNYFLLLYDQVIQALYFGFSYSVQRPSH